MYGDEAACSTEGYENVKKTTMNSVRIAKSKKRSSLKRKKKSREYEDEEESSFDEGPQQEDEDKEAQDRKEARAAMKEAAQWLHNEGKRARKKSTRYS